MAIPATHAGRSYWGRLYWSGVHSPWQTYTQTIHNAQWGICFKLWHFRMRLLLTIQTRMIQTSCFHIQDCSSPYEAPNSQSWLIRILGWLRLWWIFTPAMDLCHWSPHPGFLYHLRFLKGGSSLSAPKAVLWLIHRICPHIITQDYSATFDGSIHLEACSGLDALWQKMLPLIIGCLISMYGY